MLFSGAANINISHTVLMAKCFCFYMQRFNFLSFFFFLTCEKCLMFIYLYPLPLFFLRMTQSHKPLAESLRTSQTTTRSLRWKW